MFSWVPNRPLERSIKWYINHCQYVATEKRQNQHLVEAMNIRLNWAVISPDYLGKNSCTGCPHYLRYNLLLLLYDRLKIIIRFFINPFHATGPFRYPLKTSEHLMFSGGIERGQWHEMG